MRFTEEQIERFLQRGDAHDWKLVFKELIDEINKLDKELIASRDSRTLSAVPSEEEIEIWYIEHYGVARDLDGKPSWHIGVGYRTDGDLFEMLNDFAKWIKQRGIDG